MAMTVDYMTWILFPGIGFIRIWLHGDISTIF